MPSFPAMLPIQAFSVTRAGLRRLLRPVRRRHHRPSPVMSVIGWCTLALLVYTFVDAIDQPVSALLRAMPEPLMWFFHAMTDIGLAGVTLWPTGLAALAGSVFLAYSARPWPWAEKLLALVLLRLVFVFVAVAGSGLIVTAVKRVFGRARPWISPDNAANFELLTLKSQFVSFPSGHATAIAAGAVAIILLLPRLKAPLAMLAVLVCISRVVVGAHFPTDVMAGAAFGAAFAYGTWHWFGERALVFPAHGGQAATASTFHLLSRLASAVQRRRRDRS